MQIEIFDDEHERERSLIRVKRIHISSLVLASNSEFFFKLFSNGMKESQPNSTVTIRIYDSEEDAFMEILNFMYGMTLSSRAMKSSCTLFKVLMLADKFEIISCIEQCVQLLVDLPMTRESALLYFDIPMRSEYQPLINEATRFLSSCYEDLTKHLDELCDMPVTVMETVLCSDNVRVSSEDCVYDIALKWARKQYPRLEDRRAFLGSCITRLVRFPYLRCAKLREVLACEDLDHDFAKDVVGEALFFKVDPFNITIEACEKLRVRDKISSKLFYLGKRSFFLIAERCKSNPGPSDSFGLFLCSNDRFSEVIIVDFMFAVKKKPEMNFLNLHGMVASFKKNEGFGTDRLICMLWNNFTANDSPYFIDGVLHLKAKLSFIN
ncbi:BTB/POZ domain-containing protein POB1 [Acorus gramineus]|uniref:BTB/POZ domain-containing protein POB1 n=1 Tax=Acorus gramineus TaxID=55184 RepID=A0AAV9ALH0_ACOGR|nr:BTB/POZ domain-containing protein POB1 [Acorus gramineus]